MSVDPLSVPRTLAGRLRRGLLAAAGAPRSPLYWRALHRLLRSRAVIAAATAGVGERPLDRFWELVVSSGWPRHERGWHNYDVGRFVWQVRRKRANAARSRSRRPPRPEDGKLRVVFVGPFGHLTSFGAPGFFTPRIAGLELHVFEFEYRGEPLTSYLADRVPHYRNYAAGDRVGRLAADVNALAPDLVLLVRALDREAYELVDRLDAPCVAYLCTGSPLLYHPGVDFFINGQPEADYFVRDEGLFSGLAHARSGRERVFVGGAFYDAAGIDRRELRPWSRREPTIVVHGSLYKAASPTFLDVLLTLLAEDSALALILMGRDDGRSLDAIRVAARARGVDGRVTYEGAFSPVRGEAGVVEDPKRAAMLEHLRGARLAPNPFPIGGGSSRMEAYGCGAPSVHMALLTDPASWGKPQLTTVDAPFLNVAGGTATSVTDYLDLCRRCLNDAEYADALVAAQTVRFAELTDPTRWWADVIGFYERWLASPR